MRKLILSLAVAGALIPSGVLTSNADAMARGHGARAMHVSHQVGHVRHVRLGRHVTHIRRHLQVRHIRHLRMLRLARTGCTHVWHGRYHRNVRCHIIGRYRAV